MILKSWKLLVLASFVAVINLHAVQNQLDSMIYVLNKTKKNEAEAYKLIQKIIEASSDADSKIYYCNLAIDLAKKLDEDIGLFLQIKGIAFQDKGNLSKALEIFFELAELRKKTGNTIGLAAAYGGISELYGIQDNYQNSIIYLKKAIEIFKGEDDPIKLASANHNLGYLYYQTGNYDSALILYQNSQEVFKKKDSKLLGAYCTGNLGVVHSRLGHLDTAQKYLLSSIDLLSGFEDNYAVTDFLIENAKILALKNKPLEAIYNAKKSYGLANTINNIAFQRDAAQLLSKLYRERQIFDSAYYYQAEYIVLNDSIKNIESVQRLADLRTGYEVAEKQIEVDVYRKKWIVQIIIICSLGLILILSGTLVYVYYANLKKARKFTKILNERRGILEKQSEELKELNRIKDKFFSIISHDLRGPISSIGGISILIKESMASDNKVLLNEITDYIDHTVLSLTGLLENLLNWAQSQQGHFPYNEETINLRVILSDVVKLFSTISISKNVKIELDLQDGLNINGDKNSLMTIFRNLLSNAFKFTEIGGTIRVACHETKGADALVEISDTGIGISAEKIPDLFRLKEDKSTWGTEREKGFGLGLTLVGEFVKLNKGEIKVKSALGKGTTFSIVFPLG